jgi:hypothetical protein
MIRIFSLLALAALAVPAQAFIVIDTFEQGYHLATITGEGNRDNFVTGLDRDKVYAGHRYTNYTVNGNPFGYTTTFEVGLGEARVVTPGPNDLSTELDIAYGTGFGQFMRLDLSWFQGVGPMLEIDLGTRPRDLFAEVWSVYFSDGQGRSIINSRPGLRDGGIFFRKDGFVGNPAFDWSDVQTLRFRQSWNRTRTAPLEYWATEMRVVPEPATVLVFLAAAVTAARKRSRQV